MDYHERVNQMAALVYLIHRQWWRPLKNRSRRKEVIRLYVTRPRPSLPLGGVGDAERDDNRDPGGGLPVRPPAV